ncbi:MAG: PIN domain-containing protein [Candidatus ainarchaeum sp.]|nr:PIN domain-containing protein [Candidatus ainarchaeum sp.]
MHKKFYIDTSIWRDYFEDRKDNIRPLGEFAFQFLKKCLKEKVTIIISNIVMKELKKYFSGQQVQTMLQEFSGIIVETKHTKKQEEEALNLLEKFRQQSHLADIIHAIIARDSKAILVSRDKHFAELNIIETRLPEELL